MGGIECKLQSTRLAMAAETDPLLTDLYQLTMLQGYFLAGMNEIAVFEFFVRRLPPSRNFLIAAGLDPLLDYLEHLSFDVETLAWLAETKRYRPDFLNFLSGLRFTGDVNAMPEGTPCFANEPIVQVVAPLCEAQLIESRLINLMHFATLIASKAARATRVARGRLLVDFGMRRAHGAEAALQAARSSYLAGFSGTSTVAAGRRYGIPLFGTMAHSFIEAHDREEAAFENFVRSQPGPATLLIDTYDTLIAAEKLVSLGIPVAGVRLDSGDLGALARKVRKILDHGGLSKAKIFASGNLDERGIQALISEGAPIDGFGIGTHLTTSADAPYLDCAYKLQEYAGIPRRKRSEGKATWPGRKQVFRRRDSLGRYLGDMIGREGESASGTKLLWPAMRSGRRLPSPTLEEIRVRTRQETDCLPELCHSLERVSNAYPVEISMGVRAVAQEIDRRQ